MDTSIVDQKKYAVYVITNRVNGKQYVGITIHTLDYRLRGHFNRARAIRDNRKFHNAIRKYGECNFVIEQLDTADSFDELKEKEKRYIAELGTFTHGYNSTLGGDGTLGAIVTDDLRERRRKQKTAHFAVKANRDRLSRMNAVLSDDQVLEICRLATVGEFTTSQIAEKFGVSPITISEILNFRTYRHVDRAYAGSRRIEAARMKVEMESILSLYESGLEYAEIGDRLGLDRNTVWRKLKTHLGCPPVSPDERRRLERIRMIVDEYRSGIPLRDIANSFGVHKETARKYVKTAGAYRMERSNGETE